MAKPSFLGQSRTSSMILGQSHLKPHGANIKRKAATLMITSLVDAFSILLIYLLFGPSVTGESVNAELGVKLPIAYQSQLTDQETTLLIKNKHYFLDTHEVTAANLGLELKKISKSLSNKSNKALVIIADQKNDIETLNPVVIAAAEAEMSQLRLAVEHRGE